MATLKTVDGHVSGLKADLDALSTVVAGLVEEVEDLRREVSTLRDTPPWQNRRVGLRRHARDVRSP